MSTKASRKYYEKRANDARSMAESADNPAVEAIHLELARNYDLLAAGASPEAYIDSELANPNTATPAVPNVG